MPDPGSDALASVAGLDITFFGGVLSLCIDRPETLNSLTVPVTAGIADAIEQAAGNPAVKLVRLGGLGRAFSSGTSMSVDDVWGGGSDTHRIVTECHRAVRAIAGLPCPVVAVVQGPAAGVAISLALACDFVFASDHAYFILAHTKVGLMPDGGASTLVAAAVGRIRAMRLALLPERLSSPEALAWGLVSAVYPADAFQDEVNTALSALLRGPTHAFAKTKQAINAATLTELEAAFERESTGQRDLLRSTDFSEGATAFRQQRLPHFTGS